MSCRQRRETGETSDKRTKQHQAHSTTKTDAINFYFFSFLLSLLICSQFRWNVICVCTLDTYDDEWGPSSSKSQIEGGSSCLKENEREEICPTVLWPDSSLGDITRQSDKLARAYSETDRLSYRVGSRLDTTFDRLRPKASEQIMTSSGFKGEKNGDDPLSEKRVWIFPF